MSAPYPVNRGVVCRLTTSSARKRVEDRKGPSLWLIQTFKCSRDSPYYLGEDEGEHVTVKLTQKRGERSERDACGFFCATETFNYPNFPLGIDH